MEYRSAHQNVMDLIQEGNIGLMKAVSKYDRSKGASYLITRVGGFGLTFSSLF